MNTNSPRTSAPRPRDAGVDRIVYLGGLGDDDTELSEHLGSRHEVGRVLAAGPVECVELRAAAIIGSGSASFEMLRYLTEVLPVMVTPQWVRTECQPIAIRDVLRFLVAVVEHQEPIGGVLEIGGPDVLSYADMMATYAEVAGLRAVGWSRSRCCRRASRHCGSVWSRRSPRSSRVRWWIRW